MSTRKTAEKNKLFGEALLEWYHTRNNRSFPWRRSHDPYQVLVAEIMLQRTKAKQVVPVFLSFMQRFPTAEKLNDASLSEIEFYFLKLGLFWRAENVKKLAKKIVEEFAGKIPGERERLITLPGVGDYVADAVLCFAHSQDVAIVDSNVCRIIGRVFGLKKKKEARRDPIYRRLARELLPKGKCKEFNWALIDHASTICVPNKPKCTSCPLNSICLYYRPAFSR
jgi:A/G-specific adenine glycosylase